jgi:hypothetical protein
MPTPGSEIYRSDGVLAIRREMAGAAASVNRLGSSYTNKWAVDEIK